MLLREEVGDRSRERLRYFVRGGRVERHIHLQSLRSRDFRKRLEPQPVEQVFQTERDSRAGQDIAPFPGIQVERDRGGCADWRIPMQERMNLEARDARGPGERGPVIDDNVVDRRFCSVATWDGNGAHPMWRKRRRVLVPERLAMYSLG